MFSFPFNVSGNSSNSCLRTTKLKNSVWNIPRNPLIVISVDYFTLGGLFLRVHRLHKNISKAQDTCNDLVGTGSFVLHQLWEQVALRSVLPYLLSKHYGGQESHFAVSTHQIILILNFEWYLNRVESDRIEKAFTINLTSADISSKYGAACSRNVSANLGVWITKINSKWIGLT